MMKLGITIPLLAVALAGCTALRLPDTPAVSEADWPTEGDAPDRANRAAEVVATPLEPVWEYDAAAGFGAVSPIVVGDVVFVANRKGEVHAVDLETGGRRGQESFGESIEGSPAVADGVLYVPVGWGGAPLRAYDLREGDTRWTAEAAPIEAGLLLVPARDGDLVIAADVEGVVRAYGADEGEVVWERALGERVSVRAAPVLSGDGRIVVADDRGRIFALDPADGSVEWRRDLGAPVLSSPAAADGALYIPTTRGRLFALDAATGEPRWRFALPDTTVYLTAPAVDDDLVVVAATDGAIRALDPATGAERWSRSFDDAFSAPPLLTPDAVLVGSLRSELRALSRTGGEVVWTHELGGRVKSPMAAADGGIVVLAEPRLVYFFRSAPAKDYVSTE